MRIQHELAIDSVWVMKRGISSLFNFLKLIRLVPVTTLVSFIFEVDQFPIEFFGCALEVNCICNKNSPSTPESLLKFLKQQKKVGEITNSCANRDQQIDHSNNFKNVQICIN